MKYELRTMHGGWVFGVEGDTVYPDYDNDIDVNYVSCFNDHITIGLNNAPYRIDVTDRGFIWLHGEKFCKAFNDPYKSLDSETSKTVFKRED